MGTFLTMNHPAENFSFGVDLIRPQCTSLQVLLGLKRHGSHPQCPHKFVAIGGFSAVSALKSGASSGVGCLGLAWRQFRLGGSSAMKCR